jgi:dTDP-4-dehydrorhamnose 3,5-epimerase
MNFEPTEVDGAWQMALTPHEDERGFFARAWSAAEFRERALVDAFDQCSLSYNHRAGTLRGLHYQIAPREETKIVRCIRGAVFDVLVDLRRDSRTFKRWVGRELSDANRLALYVPRGVAHGFQTLTDNAEVLYLIAGEYDPALARGVRWNDPAFAIRWPHPPTTIAARDQQYADFHA